MTFDVTKFLALTAVLAGAGITAVACSGDKGDDDTSGGGAGGDSADGAATGGAGGDSAGGAGGAGGESGACIVNDPSNENPCVNVTYTEGCDGAAEGQYDPLSAACSNNYYTSTTVLEALVACGLAGASADPCADAAVVAGCTAQAVAKACDTEEATAACTDELVGLCDGFTTGECQKVLSVSNYIESDAIADCFDPAGGYYDAAFAGSCSQRLAACNATLSL